MMIKLEFTELNFAGYERKHTVTVDSYNITANKNGSYNISYAKNGKNYLFTDCSHPKIINTRIR